MMRPNKSVRVGFGALLAFEFVRRVERLLPPPALYRVMAAFVAFRVAFKRAGSPRPLPACLGEGLQFRMSRRQHRNNRLNELLEFFPDQLGTARWLGRARISGAEYLEAARRKKRPALLAFCHFGPYFLLRCWLRAAGFPAATVVKGQSSNRSAIKLLKDGASPFPEIPTALYQEDQLREIVESLAPGNILLIAMDGLRGKQIKVPVDDRWRFAMASGVLRLAMRQQAELIPCSIVDEGGWRFRITLGPPVPAEIMQAGDMPQAGKHLLDALLPELRAHPEQCAERLLKLFQRADVDDKSCDELSRSGQFIAG